MRKRPLGQTGLEISEFVFGSGRTGGLMIDADDQTQHEAVRRLVAAGVNWIDTAPAYGDGASERALGRLLAEIDDPIHVSSKVRIDPTVGDVAGQVERSLHESLERLDREHVDVLQLHNRIEPDATRYALGVGDLLGPGGVADGLDRLVEQGLVGHRGITAIGDAAACHDVVASSRFDTAQIYYNLLNPSAGRSMRAAWSGYDFNNLIAACVQHGIGVFGIRVLAAGIIATDVRHGREVPIVANSEVDKDEKRTLATFDALGERSETRAQTAIRYALSHPGLSCAIVGIADLDQLDEALAAQVLGPLPAETLAQIAELHDNHPAFVNPS